MSWSQPPHPIDVIASFDPHGTSKAQARAVLYDFMHDSDMRDWANQDDVKKGFGVQKKEDLDPTQLIVRYENGSAPKMSDLQKALSNAIAKRVKLGKLPKSTYDTDPVTIYYYDTEKIKVVKYPRSSIKADAGYALDLNNIYWWKNHDIHTQELHSDGSWGDEGFDYDKDVVGNIGQIVGTIISIVGVVLEIIPGVGQVVGTTLIVLGPVIGAALNVADTAFQQGDLGKALTNLGTAIMKLAGQEAGASGICVPPDVMKTVAGGMQLLAADLDAGQKSGKSFEDSWNVILSQSSKYGPVNDQTVNVIGKSLMSPPAEKLLHAGYNAAHYADMKTLGAVGLLFPDSGAGHVFLFGAGLGALAMGQHASKSSPSKMRNAQLSASMGRGLHAPVGASGAQAEVLRYAKNRYGT
jgi:hypothetical protein